MLMDAGQILSASIRKSGFRSIPRRYRVAGIAVWRNDDIGDSIPRLFCDSPEERIVQILPKIQEYLLSGVENVWVIDPDEKSALLFLSSAFNPNAEPPAGNVTR